MYLPNYVARSFTNFTAMEQVRRATRVMSEVETSLNRKCFAITEDSLLMSQNQVLRDVLQTQMNFLKKHVHPLSKVEVQYEILDENYIKAAVSDVNKILSTLSYALDGALCARVSNLKHQGNNEFRQFYDVDIDGLDEIIEGSKDPGFSPKSCVCSGQFCADPPTCPAACKRVCWQRYSLNHWGCQAINGGTAVSLNVVCDGKLDCFDETDETLCQIGTHSKYSYIPSLLNPLRICDTKNNE